MDVSRVLDQSPQAEEARQRIQAEFAPIDQEILSLQRELRALEEELLRDGAVMANADRMRLERDVLSRKRDLRRNQEEFREDLNLRRNQELQKLQRQVVLAIRAMAKSEGYDLVISDGVLFASERVDITGRSWSGSSKSTSGRAGTRTTDVAPRTPFHSRSRPCPFRPLRPPIQAGSNRCPRPAVTASRLHRMLAPTPGEFEEFFGQATTIGESSD